MRNSKYDIINPLVSESRPTPARDRNRSLLATSGAISANFCGNIGADAMIIAISQAGYPICVQVTPIPTDEVFNEALQRFIADREPTTWITFASLRLNTLFLCFASEDDARRLRLMM